MSGIEFFVNHPDHQPKTEAGENLKKIIETPVELGMAHERGLGVIDGQSTAERSAEKLNAEVDVPADKVLTDDAGPMLEVEKPETVDKTEIKRVAELSHNQNLMTQRAMKDPDDPSVLLQNMLGTMPGMTNSLSADMAIGTSRALNNLGVTANRMHKLEERAKRQGKPDRKGRRRR